MPVTYDDLGIRFLFPENWSLEADDEVPDRQQEPRRQDDVRAATHSAHTRRDATRWGEVRRLEGWRLSCWRGTAGCNRG